MGFRRAWLNKRSEALGSQVDVVLVHVPVKIYAPKQSPFIATAERWISANRRLLAPLVM
jgi:hypothetical protein